MNPTCQTVQTRIVDLFLGVGDAAVKSEIRTHVEACSDCRGFLQRLRAQDKNLANLAQTLDADIARGRQKALAALESASVRAPAAHIRAWRTVTTHRLAPFAIAAALLVAAVAGIVHYAGPISTTSLAFGDVLKHIQNTSYTFDLTLAVGDADSPGVLQGSVLEPGHMRIDCPAMPGLGAISSVMDVRTGRCLILFHKQKTGELLTNPLPNRNAGGGGLMAFFTQPVKALWNLRDGTETPLGKKTLDGRKVEGFQVHMEDEGDIPRDAPLQYDVQIWADAQTAEPVLVEFAMAPRDGSEESICWTMSRFELDVPLDKTLFSLEAPAGYTLAHQKDLDEVAVGQETSSEAEKIVTALALATQGDKDKAVETLLSIDWTKPIAFGPAQYMFTMTEKQYITLKPDDQQKVMTEVMTSSSTVRTLARELVDRAKAARDAGDRAAAEKRLHTAEQLGRLIAGNDDTMLINRLVGIAVQKLALNAQIELHQAAGDAPTLQQAQQRLQAVQALGDEIKKQATGQ